MIYERVKNSNVKEISREEGLGWEEVELIFNHLAKELEREEWEEPEREQVSFAEECARDR
jgi:hypothetical protein